MSTNLYEKLREFLDQFPVGMPKSESGIEIKILKNLFTEEEAKIAVLLSIIPKTVAQIARKSELSNEEMKEKLESMSKNGLIFRVRRRGKTYYNSAPIMIGKYEYSVKKLDEELAELYKQYYEEVLMDEIGATKVPGFKVLPIEEIIDVDTVLLPYHKIIESIKNARKIAVTDCICRKEARLTGEGCNHPSENCLSFGVAADFYIENEMDREINAEEAIKIIMEADESGLVHAGANTKHLSNICNCCPCCCVSMKGMTTRGYDKEGYMNALFESIIDKEICVGCGSCIERCPVGAIMVDEKAIVDREKCLGCGLCATICPEEAITIQLREDREEPFDRVIKLGEAMIEKKRELQK